MLSLFAEITPYVVASLTLTANLLASGHALLRRRDVHAAISWIGFIWLVPWLGAVLYLLFGINRIRRRARALGRSNVKVATPPGSTPRRNTEEVVVGAGHLAQLMRLVDQMVHQPLLPGNEVELLMGGDEAFPALLEAIDRAEHSVSLCSYIFDADRAGHQFADALERAVHRGVEVRVLVDAAGARYGWPPIHTLLRRRGVRVARFLPTLVPRRFTYLNLRNHRKIAVVDGKIGFTGGMNIREGNLLRLQPAAKHPIRDVHARLRGPVVVHLQRTFAEDWLFTCGESLQGARWFPPLQTSGTVFARGVPDGPDEDFEHLRLALLGAIAVAQHRLRIMTPYFLPDQALITALNVAAMRGVQVDIVLPSQSNLRLVQWATWAMLWQVIERGCRIWLTPPPFEHTKLMTVDDGWLLLGSGNWDARSLRLNFEFNVECYDRALAGRVGQLIDDRIATAQRLLPEDLDRRPLTARLRDSLAHLFSPYL